MSGTGPSPASPDLVNYDTAAPVLHVVVVGFHHKKGCQVTGGSQNLTGWNLDWTGNCSVQKTKLKKLDCTDNCTVQRTECTDI